MIFIYFNIFQLNEWILINRACFTINEILEHADEDSKNEIKNLLLDVKKKLEKVNNHAGAKVLIKKL